MTFEIDVKGIYQKNYFLLSPKAERSNLYYVLTHVPQDAPNDFFILSEADANKEVKENISQRGKAAGVIAE